MTYIPGKGKKGNWVTGLALFKESSLILLRHRRVGGVRGQKSLRR